MGKRKQGRLLCDDCLGHGAPVKGGEAAATEKGAGASGSTEAADEARISGY